MRNLSLFETKQQQIVKTWILNLLAKEVITTYEGQGDKFCLYDRHTDQLIPICTIEESNTKYNIKIWTIKPVYPLNNWIYPFRTTNRDSREDAAAVSALMADTIIKQFALNKAQNRPIHPKTEKQIEFISEYIQWETTANGSKVVTQNWKNVVQHGKQIANLKDLNLYDSIKQFHEFEKFINSVEILPVDSAIPATQLAPQLISYVRFRQTGSKLLYVEKDVVSPFLKTKAPTDDFEIIPPTWGRHAMFQFDKTKVTEIKDQKLKEAFEGYNRGVKIGTGKIISAELDSMLFTYLDEANEAVFTDYENISKLNREAEKIKMNLENGYINQVQAQKLISVIVEQLGGIFYTKPAYELILTMSFTFDDETKILSTERFLMTDLCDPKNTIIFDKWGKKSNEAILSLIMNLLYALNRTHIIEKRKMKTNFKIPTHYNSKKLKKDKSFNRIIQNTRKIQTYTSLSLDTKFKATIKYSNTENKSNGIPTRSVRPYEREAHWKRVWILPKNLESWDRTPDGERVHPTSGNTHYRVPRWCKGSSVNGGSIDTQKRITKIKKWKTSA